MSTNRESLVVKELNTNENAHRLTSLYLWSRLKPIPSWR